MQEEVAVASERRHAARGDRQHGFTLLELLIAGAVVVLILLSLSGLLVSLTRAYGVTEEASLRQQEIEAAVKILSYDLALAGYRGTDPTLLASRAFVADTVEIDVAGASDGESDLLTIRYYEDRFFTSAEAAAAASSTCNSDGLCVVVYDVDVDPQVGEGLVLLRYDASTVVGSDAALPIVQSIESFRVANLIRRDGSLIPDPTATTTVDLGAAIRDLGSGELAGLNLEITFVGGGMWRFPVGIGNPQVLTPPTAGGGG